MQLHVDRGYTKRQREAARRLRTNPHLPVGDSLNRLIKHSSGDTPATDGLSIAVSDYLGITPTADFLAAAPETAARMLEQQQPDLMANRHATMMSSLWHYYQRPYEHHPDFYRRLETCARRITWSGHPYTPATRWEFADGSALVVYGGSIQPAVHRERIELIAADYRAAAWKSIRRLTMRVRIKGYQSGAVPLVPHPAFAPANDSVLHHQAALPLQYDRCWCFYEDLAVDNPNRLLY